jgi:GntR family transcriptional regulator, transcriptional repressor for pyruvate dehydrogenase complex
MTSALPLPPRVSRAAHVARELEASLEAARRRPGERIATKEELRERFGVALATINEAVRLLETRGVIEARPGPGGGIFVARAAVRLALMHTVLGIAPESTTYREYLTVRDALEPLVCREAARAARPADVAELRATVERMEALVDDPPAYFRANWELHRLLALLSGNAPLRSIYLTLVGYLEQALEGAVFDAFDGPASAAVHRELVEAIAQGPGPRLEAAIAAHAPLGTVEATGP